MLKILETTPNRLVIKSERRKFDIKIRVLFIYVAIYFLLISTFKKWTIFGLSQKAVESIYQLIAYPPLYYFSSIALIICVCFLFAMTIVDFHLPVRTIIFGKGERELGLGFKPFPPAPYPQRGPHLPLYPAKFPWRTTSAADSIIGIANAIAICIDESDASCDFRDLAIRTIFYSVCLE